MEKNFFDKLLGRTKKEFNAELAWIESTYGVGSFEVEAERIKAKQNYIKCMIMSKFKDAYDYTTDGRHHSYSAYHCVIDIEEDLAGLVDVVFEPFVKQGFTIINLSEQVKEIDEPNVYLISWKNVFNKKNTTKEIEKKPELICD